MVMLPLFAFALYEKDGLPLEAFIENYIRVRFLYPRVRPYQTENFYRLIQSEVNHRKEIRISAAKKKCNKWQTKKHTAQKQVQAWKKLP